MHDFDGRSRADDDDNESSEFLDRDDWGLLRDDRSGPSVWGLSDGASGWTNAWRWWGHGGWNVEPSVAVPEITLTPAYQPMGPLLYGDQTLDAVYLLRDLNGDGDANDEEERQLFFNEDNESGLVNPTASVFNLHQASDGTVYVGDGASDTVYAVRDLNADGDGNDAGEARVWFSADNAEGFSLVTPNGIAEGPDAAIYVVNAGTASSPDDAVYRTEDLNGDGDANDLGESSLWIDLKTLNPSSSAFDISFADGVAYVTDSVGGDPDTIYRLEDVNGNGVIDADEAKVFIQEGNPFGVEFDFSNAVQGDSVLTWEALDFAGPLSVYRLTDLNGSGDIDQADEVREVWNSDLLPEGFGAFAGFSIAASENGDVVITSNGSTANPGEDSVYRLVDLNGDGDYKDAGETIVAVSRAIVPDFAVRPRALAYYDDGETEEHPLTYREGGEPVQFAADLTISDSDSTWLRGATVQIVGGLDSEADVLSVERPSGSRIRSHYDEETCTLTLSGRASIADYQEVLRSLAFESRVDDPDEALRQITITVRDERGEAGSSEAVATTLAVETDPDFVTQFGNERGNFLKGDAGSDRILGDRGNDIIKGRKGSDELFGEQGNDWIFGGKGDDLLSGGAGYDVLFGGRGGDRFLFTGESKTDIIADFDVLEDDVVLEGVTLNGETVLDLSEAASAARSIGPAITVYEFDNDATLWVVEPGASIFA